MDSAYCTSDNTPYDAADFARLAPAILEERRRALLCNGCGNEAFFRSASTSGRGPCFGARPHKPGCSEGTVDAGTWGTGGTEIDEPITNAAGHIVIALPPSVNAGSDAEIGGAEQRTRGAGRIFGGEGGHSANSTRRRLSTLLRRLNTEPYFQFSDTIIHPPNGYEQTTVREFFVPFEGVETRAMGQFKGLWGLITDASFDAQGSLWLNTGNRSAISFVIGPDLAAEFLAHWRLPDAESISGARALILATPRGSQRGKVFAPVDDLRFAVLDVA